MAKPHKYQFANIQLNTRITAESLHQLVQDLAATRKRIRFHSRSGNDTYFFVKNLVGGSILDFTVTITDNGEHRSLSTGIDEAVIVQEKFLVFIPIGPKQMTGYPEYRKFMMGLAQAAQSADPQAQAVITERHN